MRHHLALLGTLSSILIATLALPGSTARAPVGASAIGPVAETSPLRRPGATQDTITIVGEVDGRGDVTVATVRVHVGPRTQTHSVAIAPTFQVQATGRTGEMVVLEVEAPGMFQASVVGSFDALRKAAGTDRVLTVGELDTVRISPFSTALAFFVQREVGMRPTSDAQLRRALRSMTGANVVRATALLHAVAEGNVVLPDGFPHAYALLQDREAYTTFMNSEASWPLDEIAAIDATPSVADSTTWSGPIALLGRVPDQRLPLAEPEALVVEPAVGGYRVHSGELYRTDSRYSGAVDAEGQLILEPDGFVGYDSFGSYCESTGQLTIETHDLVSERYRVLRGGALPLQAVLTRMSVTQPNCPGSVARIEDAVSLRVAIRLDRLRTFWPRAFGGHRTLPHFCTSTGYLAACEHAIHRFATNGTGDVLDVGAKVDELMVPAPAEAVVPFTWSRSGPAIQVQLPDASARFWTVDPGNSDVAGVVHVAERGSGIERRSVAGYAAMLRVDPGIAFGQTDALGTWRTSVDSLQPDYYVTDGPRAVTRIMRTVDGTSVYAFTYPEAPEYDYEQTYQLQFLYSSIYESRVFADTGRSYRDCDAAYADGATVCFPFRTYYFRPLLRRGDRVYGLRETYANHTGQPPYYITRSSRPIYQDLE